MDLAQMEFGLNRAPTSALQKLPAVPPLPGVEVLTRVTLYVDSVNGDDSNPGTEIAPYRTLQRAWFQRQQYLELRCVLTIQLLGVGPYPMPPMGASVCSADGAFVIRGDAAARTVLVTGTATGDFATNTLPTSALGGTDNVRDAWCVMTSGACAGAVFQINSNTANSLTVSNKRARTQLGAVVNGDTFQIVRPGTELRVTLQTFTPPLSLTPHNIANWRGMSRSLFGEPVPKHWLFDLRVTTTDSSPLTLCSSELGLSMCTLERGIAFDGTSFVVGGVLPWSGLVAGGTIAFDQRLFGAGFIQTVAGSIGSTTGGKLFGVFSWQNGLSMFFGMVVWCGGRAGASTTLNNSSQFEGFGSDQDNLINATVTVGPGSCFRVVNIAGWRAVLAAGSVMLARRGGLIVVEGSFTGGTAAAGAYGYDVRGGGRCIFVNQTPALTGGTAGEDLRTTNVAAIPNATLNANGVAAGNAADALLGEVLARVAA